MGRYKIQHTISKSVSCSSRNTWCERGSTSRTTKQWFLRCLSHSKNLWKSLEHIYHVIYSIYIYLIWVNYNISLTWIKATWGWFPLLTMIPGFGRSEVVIKFTQIILSLMVKTWLVEHHGAPRFADFFSQRFPALAPLTCELHRSFTGCSHEGLQSRFCQLGVNMS